MVKMLDLAAPANAMVLPDPEYQLLARLHDGDQAALRVLFDAYFDRLASVALHFVQDQDMAKDVSQSVFINLWEKRQQVSIDTAIYPYLRKMAINNALAILRTAERRGELLEKAPRLSDNPITPDDTLLHGELNSTLDEAIAELPPQSGAVFRLSRFEDLSNKEIAQTMNISVKTVENHMTRALSQLRKALTQYMRIFL